MLEESPKDLPDLRSLIRGLMEQKILPHIAEYEQKSILPKDFFHELGKVGALKAHLPEAAGGFNLGTEAYCLLCEELARGGAGLVHNGHFQTQKMLLERGTPFQRDMYLEKLLSGEYLAATAITEPEVGSSFSRMQTRSEKRGHGFVLNGIKSMINDAAEADVINVFAKTEEGMSVFLLDRDTPGFNILAKQDPIGLRSSPIYEFELRECELGPEKVVGHLGKGFETFFTAFNFSRLGNASAALGAAQASFDKTLSYLKERRVGKQLAVDFQGVRWRLADMGTRLKAARLLLEETARLADRVDDFSLESSQAKAFCVRTASRVTDECIQISGRFGCLRENLLEMYWRDAKALGTAGGSLEVMDNYIAKRLIGH